MAEGAWHLNDPALPTFSAESPIDRFPSVPGQNIPTTFLPTVWGDAGSGHYVLLSAAPAPDLAISGHYPLLLPIPRENGGETFMVRKLNLGQLAEQARELCGANLYG